MSTFYLSQCVPNFINLVFLLIFFPTSILVLEKILSSIVNNKYSNHENHERSKNQIAYFFAKRNRGEKLVDVFELRPKTHYHAHSWAHQNSLLPGWSQWEWSMRWAYGQALSWRLLVAALRKLQVNPWKRLHQVNWIEPLYSFFLLNFIKFYYELFLESKWSRTENVWPKVGKLWTPILNTWTQPSCPIGQ